MIFSTFSTGDKFVPLPAFSAIASVTVGGSGTAFTINPGLGITLNVTPAVGVPIVVDVTATVQPASKSPYILAQSAVPVILCPAGTFNASGQLTLGTALPYVPSGVVQVYLFAGNGLAAGLYPATFSSTTVCQLVGNPVTTAGAYTPSIGVNTTIASVALPGGVMGPNGSVRVLGQWTVPANTNNKFGGLQLAGNPFSWWGAGTTGTSLVCELKTLTNRGVVNKQLANFADAGFSGAGNGTFTLSYRFLSVDTSQNQVMTFQAQLSVATDYIILEGYTVEILPG